MDPSTVVVTSWSEGIWANVFVPIVAAVLAALVVVFGYLYDRRNKRRDDLRALFSDALEAVAEYQELPYLVRRRAQMAPMTSSELSARISAVQTRLDFFSTRLSLEANELGASFSEVVRTVRSESGQQISEAWRTERVVGDEEMPLGKAFPRGKGDEAKERCLSVMKNYLT